MSENLLPFIIPFGIAAALPGPAQASLVAYVISRGAVASLPFVAGMVVGNLIWLGAALFGLSVIALRYELLFLGIKWLGIVYLLFLASKLWNAQVLGTEHRKLDAGGLLPGMLLTLGNPKAVIFFGAVLPHAFDMTSLSWTEVGIIVALGLAIDLAVQSLYLFSAERARNLVRSARRMKIANRSAAGLMAGSAAFIASRG